MLSGKYGKYLITGKPKMGKTTAIMKVAEELKNRVAGFYTAEIKQGKQRLGFEIVSLTSGQRALLAHVDVKSSKQVGKYGVCPENLNPFIEEIEEVLKAQEPKIILIDEIGKMELFSQRFREVVLNAVDSIHHPLVATIMERSEPFCDALKTRPEINLLELNYENRDIITAELLNEIRVGL